jgi:hypothetical protein
MTATTSHRTFTRIPTGQSMPGNDLLESVERYFDRHPEVSREAFLRNALSRELQARRGAARRASAEEIRQHAWVEEGLDSLRHERHGLLARLRSYFGN